MFRRIVAKRQVSHNVQRLAVLLQEDAIIHKRIHQLLEAKLGAAAVHQLLLTLVDYMVYLLTRIT